MTLHSLVAATPRLLGIERTNVGHAEKWISGIGGFIGIAVVLLVSDACVGADSAGLIVASMGASAVLLFGAPHGSLSQPWPLVGGHLLSAFSGVLCTLCFPRHPWLAGALSVGLAIGLMHYARCIHPPGGATALTFALGGAHLQSLGFAYLITPVLLNVLILLALAIAANAPFPWRRYPAALARRHTPTEDEQDHMFSHEHLTHALHAMGSLIDVTPDDLAEICSLAAQHARGTHLPGSQLYAGRCYENFRDDPRWAVRRIVDELPGDTPDADVLLYWVVAGHETPGRGTCTRRAMALWAHRELTPDEATRLAREELALAGD